MAPVLQLPAGMVWVEPGAVTVTVVVVAGVVVGEPQRFSAGAGVATARAARARTETAEMRENMLEGSGESLLVVLGLLKPSSEVACIYMRDRPGVQRIPLDFGVLVFVRLFTMTSRILREGGCQKIAAL